MTYRELADKVAELHTQAPDGPWEYCLQGYGYILDAHNDVIFTCENIEDQQGQAIVALRNLAPDIASALRSQADEIDALRADHTAFVNSLLMIARFARPHAIREAKRRPSHDTGEVLSSIEFALERHKTEHNFASPWIEQMRSEIDALRSEVARLKDVVRSAEYWEALRKDERDAALAMAEALRAEIDRLKAEMSVHDTPDGGVAGMLTITPEAARGLMEGDE